jgi:hypothetical protein
VWIEQVTYLLALMKIRAYGSKACICSNKFTWCFHKQKYYRNILICLLAVILVLKSCIQFLNGICSCSCYIHAFSYLAGFNRVLWLHQRKFYSCSKYEEITYIDIPKVRAVIASIIYSSYWVILFNSSFKFALRARGWPWPWVLPAASHSITHNTQLTLMTLN